MILPQLAMVLLCAACSRADTKPAVYYVPEPVYRYERRVLSPKATHDLDALHDNLQQLQDNLRRPTDPSESPPTTADEFQP